MKTRVVPAGEIDPKSLRAEDYMKPSRAVLKVQEVLAKGVPLHAIMTVHMASKAVQVYCPDVRSLYVSMKGGHWAGFRDGEDATRTNGVIGGYSYSAVSAARALVRLRLLKETEVDEFRLWFNDTEREDRRLSELKRAEELAEKHGLKLVTK